MVLILVPMEVLTQNAADKGYLTPASNIKPDDESSPVMVVLTGGPTK